ncbi:MAG: hypothetical protein SV062_08640 [Thermodesulfobacteriota bacterium]|nr:hypothetical protein [Thermodesulfobacteriota bacterium]
MMERDVHLKATDLLNDLQFKPGDFGNIALISGQPQRVSICLERINNPVKNFSTMGYTFWTGEFEGKKVTVGNAGMYAPDTALVTEILCAGGIDNFVRLGSCGALNAEINIGDMVIPDYAIRGDGVTRYYVDDNFIPEGDNNLNNLLFDLASENVKCHRGGIWTTDAILKETKELINPLIVKGVVAVDMVTSPFFTVTKLYNKKASAILAVSDNLITGEVGFTDIRFLDAEYKMVETTFKIIKEIDG